MTDQDYTKNVLKLLNSELNARDKLIMCILGLGGEAGELQEVFKKHFFHGHTLNTENLRKELGDVTFYLYAICGLLGIDIDDVRKQNIQKLEKRYPNLEFTPERSINRVES